MFLVLYGVGYLIIDRGLGTLKKTYIEPNTIPIKKYKN